MRRRPSLPERVKRAVWERQRGICAECGKAIGSISFAEFDHRPPLWTRQRDDGTFEPPADDPDFLEALHGRKTLEACHSKRTFSQKASGPIGDHQAFWKSRRLQNAQSEHEKKIRCKHLVKPIRRWPSRKLRSAPFRCWKNMRGDIVSNPRLAPES